MFLHRDMVQPHTYDALCRDYRLLWDRAPSCVNSKSYGSHSMRIAGFNGASRAPEVEEGLPEVHGNWHGGQERYHRWLATMVLQIPTGIVNQLPSTHLPVVVSQPLAVEPPPGALPRNANPRLPIGSARSPAPRAVARPILSSPLGLARSDIHTWEPCTQLPIGWKFSVRTSRSGWSYYV